MPSSSSQENMMNPKNFSETFSMLRSQYFKENNGSFGPTPMNLSSSAAAAAAAAAAVSSPGMDLSPTTSSNREVNLMDFFPTTPNSLETPNKSKCGIAHQMTIFYGGKVVVFDDLSAAKVQEVLDLAKNFSVTNNTTRQLSSDIVAPNDFIKKDLLPPRPHQQQKHLQTINASDLPISRNASLHRFLAKRKDRINSRAPYQVAGSSSLASGKDNHVQDSKKIDERKIWLGLGSKNVVADSTWTSNSIISSNSSILECIFQEKSNTILIILTTPIIIFNPTFIHVF